MRLGTMVKDPDNAKAISINWTTYIGADTVSSCSWSAANGLTVEASPAPSLAAGVAIATVSGGQEGCDYLVTCRATLSSGVTEDGTVLVQVRTGEAEPRLTRNT